MLKKLPDDQCDVGKKGAVERSCNEHGCPQWKTSEWSMVGNFYSFPSPSLDCITVFPCEAKNDFQKLFSIYLSLNVPSDTCPFCLEITFSFKL